MRKAVKIAGLLIGMLLVLVISLGPGSLGWLWFSITVAAAIVACAWYSWAIHIKPLFTGPRENVKFPFRQVTADRVLALHEAVRTGRVPSLAQASIFAMAVVEPASVRRRVTEAYTPERRTLVQATQVDVHLTKPLWPLRKPPPNGNNGAGDSNGYVYMPAVIVPKGTLLDGFQVTGQNGETLTCLSYREYLQLVASTLRVLLATAYQLDTGQLPVNAQTAEFAALTAIIERKPPCEHLAPQRDVVDVIANLDAPNTAARNLAARFVSALISHYAIVFTADPPQNGEFAFHYTQTCVPDMKLAGFGSKRRWSIVELLRVGLGSKPVDLWLDLANAATAQSFHLHVHAPDGLYLARQEPHNLGPILQRQAQGAPTLPHCRLRRRLGQPHAHFYSRYMPKLIDGERPLIRFRFFEVPPGSSMRAAATAVACATIVWLVAFIASHVPDLNTDAPAFLLAFPAIIAAWLGFESPSQRLLEGTLAARLGLVVSAVLSIAASALFLAGKADPTGRKAWEPLPGSISLLGISDLAWAIITALTVLNAVVISYKCLKGTIEYLHLSSRPIE